MCKKRDEIRFNYKANHYGVIKKRKGKRKTAVFMSTKPFSDGKANVPMIRNADPSDSTPSYFIRRVRTYNNSYGPKQKGMFLTDNDRKTADMIYEDYRRNAAIEKKRKREKARKRKNKKK